MKNDNPTNFVEIPGKVAKLAPDARAALVRALADNLKALFGVATPNEIQDGVSWYARARGLAYTLGAQYRTTGERCAYILAALSPSNSWAKNQLDAHTVLAGVRDGLDASAVRCSTYNANKEKAFHIARTGELSAVSGQKTSAFADNIAHADSNAVTIDFHATSAATGERLTTQTATALTPAKYELISDAYRVAARELGGLKAYELQAVAWVVWRRIIGIHESKG